VCSSDLQLKGEARGEIIQPPQNYDEIVTRDIANMTVPELWEYATKHNLVLYISKKAKKENIRNAIIEERTKQLMEQGEITQTPKTYDDYVDDVQRDIRGLNKTDLLEYAFSHQIDLNLPSSSNKTEIKIAVIRERVNQLMKGSIGSGLRKRRKIVGRGYSDDEDKPVRKNTIPKKVINGKFIDLNKLKNNILTVRYLKTGGFVPTVKSQHISNDVKSVIEDIINDKFEKRLYEKLQPDEKRLVKRLVGALKIDIDVNTKEDDEYRKQFEIVLGEFQAGNTSPAIKNKLKQYVAESMQSGMITRREAWQLLYELTINN
jgi:hypothetical protein